MLLVMRNLPSDIKYSDIKSLIQNKCFVGEVILDKLIKDGATTKRVTVGVAKEEDAERIKDRLNGTIIGGLPIYVEDMKNSKSGNNSDMTAYQGQNYQNQQSSQHSWSAQQTGYQYGYGMPANQTGYQTQQGMNQQGISQQTMSYGYGTSMTSNNSGVSPLMQNNFMGYANQQGQQGQSTSQGQFGGSGPRSSAMGAQEELGFGYTSGNIQTNRERGPNNARGYGSQASYSGNQKDGGSQGSWRDSQQNRGFGSQKSSNERNTRGYGSGNFDTLDTRFGSGNAQKDSRGYGSQQPYNQRGFDSNDSWGSSNRGSGGFNLSCEGGDREDRKRRHSPEREGRYLGNSRDGFQGGNFKFEGNQGRGFDSNRDSRNSYNRAGPSRDNYSATPAPLLGQTNGPYSWSNSSNTSSRFEDKPQSFGGDYGSNYNKDRNNDGNDSKPRIVWNSKYQSPRSLNSPTGGPPEKRAKLEENPSVNVVAFDQKTANRAISWRGEGVSVLAKEIFKHQGPNHPLVKKQVGLKLLKKALNSRIEEIIKQKYPNDPYPLLTGPQIVELYRGTYPVRTDEKLCMSCAQDAPPTGTAAKKAGPKANIGPPASTVTPMGPPSATTVPQATPTQREVKPFLKPFPKPKLSDLLPPQLLNQPPRNKLMLGPNALKKKPKPYNVEKRAKAEQRQLSKREFLDKDMYKCKTPAMEKALNDVLDEITDVFNSAVDEHPTDIKEEKLIGDTIKLKAGPEFRSMVRLHTIKRILNVTNTLMLRIFVAPGKASKDNVEQALKPYGLRNLKSSTQSKTPMFMADVRTYHNYDRLCTTSGIPVEGRNGPCLITAKPLHLTMPFKFRRLLRQKQYAEMTGDHEENDDFGKNVKDEDDDDDGDGDDEDVVDMTKEDDVIELSGDEIKDEKPEIKTEDDVEDNEIEANTSGSKADTVDLAKDDGVDLSVDEKISVAIAEQMGDSVVEIDEEEIREDDLEDY